MLCGSRVCILLFPAQLRPGTKSALSTYLLNEQLTECQTYCFALEDRQLWKRITISQFLGSLCNPGVELVSRMFPEGMALLSEPEIGGQGCVTWKALGVRQMRFTFGFPSLNWAVLRDSNRVGANLQHWLYFSPNGLSDYAQYSCTI